MDSFVDYKNVGLRIRHHKQPNVEFLCRQYRQRLDDLPLFDVMFSDEDLEGMADILAHEQQRFIVGLIERINDKAAIFNSQRIGRIMLGLTLVMLREEISSFLNYLAEEGG